MAGMSQMRLILRSFAALRGFAAPPTQDDVC
jgi:hypothetical protein